MDEFWIRVVVGTVFLGYCVVFAGIMVWLRTRGLDPKGSAKEYTLLAKLSSVFTVMWLGLVALILWNPRFSIYLGHITWLDPPGVHVAALILMVLGLFIEILGIWTLGRNFRVSMPTDNTTLITYGIYGVIRNPIVLAVFLLMGGTFFFFPNLLSLLTLVGIFITYNAKVDAEESYLARTFGEDWDSYKARTGKYFPRLRQRVSHR